ncbi:MAG: quinol:cytochrome C oxidoreductase [Sphingobacteriales bacterium]
MKTHNSFDEQYQFTGKAKTWSLVAIAIGVITIIAGFLTGHEQRTFSNLLLMGYYFTCVCAAGVMFCAIQYAAQAGWSAAMLRIPQAFGKVLPIAALLLVIIVVAGLSITHTVVDGGGNHVEPYLYARWATHDLHLKGSGIYDAVIVGKEGFLNKPFFLIRMVGMLGCYSLFGWLLYKYSSNEDEVGGMKFYNKSFLVSCVFLVLFGFTVPVFAFDTVMSLEARWFSTMFGWYNLAGLWVSGLSVMALMMIYLRKAGYMSWLTEDHLHNMGLFMFAFSVFWTYLWFGQFLLTYYANIPEESAYFYRRWEPDFMVWFWLNIAINFGAPLLILMSRDSKRYVGTLKVMCIILICGHWLDYFQMIAPNTIAPHAHWYWKVISPIEPGIFIGFAGLFTFLVLNALSKFKSLIPKKHPFLEESLHHHI